MLHSQWNRPNELPHIQWLREFRTQELNFILSQIAELLDDRILFLLINGPIGFSRIDHGDNKNLSLIVKRIGIAFVFSGELSLPAGNMWFWFPMSMLRLRLLRGLRLICSATSGAAFMRMPQQIFQAVEFFRSRTLSESSDFRQAAVELHWRLGKALVLFRRAHPSEYCQGWHLPGRHLHRRWIFC